jgi:hypothetical protein
MAQSGKKSGGGFMRNWLDRFNNLRPAVRRRKPAGLDRGVSLLNIRPPDSFFPVLDLTESPVKRGNNNLSHSSPVGRFSFLNDH